MKRIAVISIALFSFAAGLNIGRYVESVKSAAPVVNVNVNGAKVEASTDKEVTCEVRDYHQDLSPYRFDFKTTKSTLLSLKKYDTINNMEVREVRNMYTYTKLFLTDEKGSGGLIIANCEYK
jgi:uncharacterized protein (UPF0335 family)